MASAGLNLVFDTNAFLHDNGLQTFKSIRQTQSGTLPQPLRIFVPHVVKMELRSISRGSSKAQPAAHAAHSFLGTIKAHDPAVSVQSKADADRIRYAFYPNQPYGARSMNDGLILLYCLHLRSKLTVNVWLVSNDSQLTARSVRSSVVCLNIMALKKAMEISRYTAACPDGDAYYDFRIPAAESLMTIARYPETVVINNSNQVTHQHPKVSVTNPQGLVVPPRTHKTVANKGTYVSLPSVREKCRCQDKSSQVDSVHPNVVVSQPTSMLRPPPRTRKSQHVAHQHEPRTCVTIAGEVHEFNRPDLPQYDPRYIPQYEQISVEDKKSWFGRLCTMLCCCDTRRTVV